MTFGKALELLKADQLVQRRDWVEKGMWLILIHGQIRKLAPGAPYTENLLRLGYAEGYSEICSHIDLHAGGGTMQPGWTPSQADMLAGDWGIVEAPTL